MGERLLSETEVRGKKEYVCCLCGLRIRKGAKHVREAYTTDSEDGVVTLRMHAGCHDRIRSWDMAEWEIGMDCADFRKFELELPAEPFLRPKVVSVAALRKQVRDLRAENAELRRYITSLGTSVGQKEDNAVFDAVKSLFGAFWR